MLMGATNTLAYDLNRDESAQYTIKWYDSEIPIRIQVPAAGSYSDGSDPFKAISESALAWNEHLANIQIITSESTAQPIEPGNGVNEVAMAADLLGEEFGEFVLAVTLNYPTGNKRIESDIVLNSAIEWDAYTGALREPTDIRRVIMHEVGHLLGLGHSDFIRDADGTIQPVTAVMNSSISHIDRIWTDDIEGVWELYGVPGEIPANDNFASAEDVPAGGNSDWGTQATNNGSSGEEGEPAHAGVAARKSVWWKWTSGERILLQVNTWLSNFDTVLAIYTGDNLDNLELVIENDDQETPEENPSSSRMRTSLVQFLAEPNTTYYIAVGGWGSSNWFPEGFSGTIKLGIEFDDSTGPPIISRQPLDIHTTAGNQVGFMVDAAGYRWLDYEWEIKMSGSSEWEPVVDLPGLIIDESDGGDSSSVHFKPTNNMQGALIRCQISNHRGSIYSAEAELSVNPVSLPVILAQPDNQEILASGQVTLEVEADSFGVAPTYQWYHQGVAIPGATQSIYHIDSASAEHAGTYRVDVINGGGVTQSSSVEVSVLAAPIITNLGSTRRVIRAGQSTTLSAEVQGRGEVQLQWIHQGRILPDATTASLELIADHPGVAGAYWLRATDEDGQQNGSPFFVMQSVRDARAVVWGFDWLGQNNIPKDLTNPLSIAIDSTSVTVVQADGYTHTWGGPLGESLADDLRGVVKVVKHRGHDLALLEDGTVVDSEDRPLPHGLYNIVDIARERFASIALRSDGRVIVWGGSGYHPTRDSPVIEDGVAISMGEYHAAVLRDNGSIVSWGNFASGGDPSTAMGVPPGQSIAVGGDHTLVLDRNQNLTYFGGYPGNPNLSGLSDVVAISSGQSHSVALNMAGEIQAWGSEDFGQSLVPNLEGYGISIDAHANSSAAIVGAPPSNSRLLNLSVRSVAASADQTLVVGFAVADSVAKPILIRSVGPSLLPFGITNALTNPQLTVYNSDATKIGQNSDWAGESTLRETFARLGAFALPENSLDAATIQQVSAGTYSVHTTAENSLDPGVTLVEIYDANSTSAGYFTNLSARTQVGTDENILVAGFVLEGDQPKHLLIRAVGPSLSAYGLEPTRLLANPSIKLLRDGETVTSNADWNGDEQLKQAFTDVGAFSLSSDDSPDAAVVVSASPGIYTIQVSGEDGGTGVALVEIYELP